jgi:hypothetical protein
MDSHDEKDPASDEPQTPMWLPALGAVMFLAAGIWWATRPVYHPPPEPEPAPKASASVAHSAAPAPPAPPHPGQPSPVLMRPRLPQHP